MAVTVTGQITIDELAIYEVTSDPSVGGLAAENSSLAILRDSANATYGAWLKTGTSATAWLAWSGLPSYLFMPDQLDTPNNADWAVNSFAPLTVDSLNNGLIIRTFDDTTNQGVGFTLPVPSGAANMQVNFKWRAQSTPAAARGIVMGIYTRQLANNAAVAAWSTKISFTTIVPATNTNYQYSGQKFTLAALGVTAGNLCQFEFIRDGAAVADTLVGNANLVELDVVFT